MSIHPEGKSSHAPISVECLFSMTLLTGEAGKKILMSGGARCNVLPVAARMEDFVTESTPRLLKAGPPGGYCSPRHPTHL